MAKFNPVQKLLLRAKSKIEKYGWIKGRFGSRSCGFCLRGAIRDSSNDEALKELAYDALNKAILQRYSIYGTVYFNDAFAKRKKQAIAALSTAVKVAA